MAPLLGPGRSTVSVVVEVSDSSAPYLVECMTALDQQDRLPDEVLLAVSGSGADTAASVASAAGEQHPFPVHVVDAAEPGVDAAAAATGSHLMVVQAGDLLAAGALRALADSLDRSGSQLAVPGVAPRAGATVATAPEAAASVELSAMMVRADHWRSSGAALLRDPVAPWLAPLHAVLRAGSIDLVPGQVLEGTPRGTGLPFGALPGFARHLPRLLPQVEELLDLLGGKTLEAARLRLTGWLVSSEVPRWAEDAERCDKSTWTALVRLVRALLAELPPPELAEVPVERRIRVRLTAQDRRQELERFNAARWHEEEEYPTEVHDGQVLAVLPVEDVPAELVTLSAAETPLVTQLRRARWVPSGQLELEVIAFTRRVGAAAGPVRVRLSLASASGRSIDLAAEPVAGPEVNLLAGERNHEHSDGLHLVRVDPVALAAAGPDRWSLQVDWERAGVRRQGTVRDVERRGSVAALPARAAGELEVSLAAATAELVCGPARPPAVEEPRSEITGLGLDGDVLVITGSIAGSKTRGDGPLRLRVRGPRGGCAVRLPVTDGPFEVALPLRHDPWGLGETPLPPGSYRLRLQAGELVLGGGLVARTPYSLLSETFRIRVARTPDGSAQLTIGAPLADDELGLRAQHELRRWYASDEHRLDPDTVYLQSYGGFTATDSPLAIHRELRRTRPHLRLVWGAADSSVVTPADADRVLLRSREFYRTLATCGHIISNIDLDEWFTKRPGQRLLHTTHGYPGKAMGLMAWETRNFTPSLVERQLQRTSGTWDLLLMPHPSIDVHYREQYRYRGPILSAGYPRDDELLAPDVEQRREDVRRRLGIGGRKAVLYAPTWRDDLTTNFRAALMPTTFDVEHASEALGEEYVILLRGHRFHRQRRDTRGRLLDVTDYPEVNDLILAADVGVLDYSSLRFDLALTGRPMLFLVPDLHRYEGGRGFMYDFRSSAPGPLLDTTAEVVAALQDLDAVARQYAAEYARFNERFNSEQDGHAAERAVEAFFGPA